MPVCTWTRISTRRNLHTILYIRTWYISDGVLGNTDSERGFERFWTTGVNTDVRRRRHHRCGLGSRLPRCEWGRTLQERRSAGRPGAVAVSTCARSARGTPAGRAATRDQSCWVLRRTPSWQAGSPWWAASCARALCRGAGRRDKRAAVPGRLALPARPSTTRPTVSGARAGLAGPAARAARPANAWCGRADSGGGRGRCAAAGGACYTAELSAGSALDTRISHSRRAALTHSALVCMLTRCSCLFCLN